MIRMFVRHPVADFAAWKRAYGDFDKERQGMGVKAHAVFIEADNRNDVTVWHDFETLESGRAFADSARLREVMAAAGVTSKPELWFTTQA